jgi:hypothetical protein
MRINLRLKPDFFYFYYLLMFFCLFGFFFGFKFKLAVINNLANRRIGCWNYLNEIKSRFFRPFSCFIRRDDSLFFTALIDKQDFPYSYLMIYS